MPNPVTAPTKTPSPSKNPEVYPGPEPTIYPSKICPQQKREHISPDISP